MVIQHKDVPAVQEHDDKCLPGSLARSIGWLDQEHTLMSNKTAQQIYGELIEKKIGNGLGLTYMEAISRKASYLQGLATKKGKKAVTKVLDVSGEMPEIKGVAETSGVDLVDWLYQELPTEDVEIDYGHHIVTITGIYKQGGMVYVKYRDDETQGGNDVTQAPNNNGDKIEKRGKITKKDGKWHFREDPEGGVASEDFKVRFVFSESIKDEKVPGTTVPEPTLPPRRGGYVHRGSGPVYITPAGSVSLSAVRHFNFSDPIRTVVDNDELELFQSTLEVVATLGGVGTIPLTFSGPVETLVSDRLDTTTGYFNTEILSMSLVSQPVLIPGMGLVQLSIRESPLQQSLGLTGVHDMFDGNYFMESFFDVFTELSFDGDSYFPSLESQHVELVPEPGGALLAIASLIGLISRGRRRNRGAAVSSSAPVPAPGRPAVR